MKTNKKLGNILVADDDPAIVDSIQFLLEEAGYVVNTTVDGNNVFTMIDNNPDLLLLDIWMSGQDGRDICKYLKSQDKTKHVPIVMISANKDTKEIAKKSGADDFLEKPFEMEDLLNKISKHIKKRNNN